LDQVAFCVKSRMVGDESWIVDATSHSTQKPPH
jgi:hypothetical protein